MMSYRKSIDEYDVEILQQEIDRRVDNGRRGLCDYCGQRLGSVPVCRFADRHQVSLLSLDSADHRLREISEWIDNYGPNKDRDPEAQTWGRVAKVAEERTEVITAMIGWTDQNPRKGRTHTKQDVLDELYDEALTALAAAVHLDEPEPMEKLRDHIARVHQRIAESEFFLASSRAAPLESDPVVLARTPEFATEEARRESEDDWRQYQGHASPMPPRKPCGICHVDDPTDCAGH